MTKRQSGTRRNRPRLGRSRLPLLMMALALFAVGLFFGIELAKPPPRPDFGPEPAGESPPATPEYPVDAGPATPVAEPNPVEVRRQPAPGGESPRVSIVIDDLGRSLADLDRLAGLGIPITYAVLPFETQTAAVVAELQRREAEILCHLPMQAKGDADPGPGALLGDMGHDELVAATRKALGAVPGAVGVNNHMGSLIASRADAMSAVLSVVEEQGLYFLDSRTSADTLGYSLAREAGLPAAERQVFLDPSRDMELIRGQFEELLRVAEQRGAAIGIAHPYPETLEMLESRVPEALARGIEFVTAGALLDD